jgi:hypothetical protein
MKPKIGSWKKIHKIEKTLAKLIKIPLPTTTTKKNHKTQVGHDGAHL